MAFLVGGRSTGRTLDLFFQEKNNDMLLPTVPNICGTIGVLDFNKSREIFILPARNYVRKNSSRVSVHLGLIIQLIALDTNTEKG